MYGFVTTHCDTTGTCRALAICAAARDLETTTTFCTGLSHSYGEVTGKVRVRRYVVLVIAYVYGRVAIHDSLRDVVVAFRLQNLFLHIGNVILDQALRSFGIHQCYVAAGELYIRVEVDNAFSSDLQDCDRCFAIFVIVAIRVVVAVSMLFVI